MLLELITLLELDMTELLTCTLLELCTACEDGAELDEPGSSVLTHALSAALITPIVKMRFIRFPHYQFVTNLTQNEYGYGRLIFTRW